MQSSAHQLSGYTLLWRFFFVILPYAGVALVPIGCRTRQSKLTSGGGQPLRLPLLEHASAPMHAYGLTLTPRATLSGFDFATVGSNQTYGWCNRWWMMGSHERNIVQHYELPIISYRDAVWPSLANPRPLLPCFWNGISHPDAIGHLLFGDVVAYGLLRSLSDGGNGADACSARQSPKKLPSAPGVCEVWAPPSTSGDDASSAPDCRRTRGLSATGRHWRLDLQGGRRRKARYDWSSMRLHTNKLLQCVCLLQAADHSASKVSLRARRVTAVRL